MTEVQPSRTAPRPRAQDIDRHVGNRIRQRRIMLGLTQQHFADLIGVTYQQAHKYEKGINRIAGGRLYQTAQALGVEVSYFYEGMADQGPAIKSSRSNVCCSSWPVAFSSSRAASIRKPSVLWLAQWPTPKWSTIAILPPQSWSKNIAA